MANRNLDFPTIGEVLKCYTSSLSCQCKVDGRKWDNLEIIVRG